MVKHIILIKLKDSLEASKNDIKEKLLSMSGKVPQILGIEVGTDFLCSARSYDVFLQVTLKDRAALDDYQADKYHSEVVKPYLIERAESIIALDYEI